MGLFDIFKKKREVYINPELPFENKFESDKTYEEIVAGVVAGDSESLFMMGCWHVGGAVVKQDLPKAVEYFTKAAKKGHALAQCELGVCYCNGDGVNIDIEEGVKWFEMSAAQGYAKAWNELCVSYNRCGVGCESLSDYNHILNSLKRAGYMPAYRTQARGEYIRGNYCKKLKLLKQLAKMGDAEAAYEVAWNYGLIGDYITAKKWLEKATLQNCPRALYYIGTFYYYGQGVAKDLLKAVEWWQKSADQGETIAQYRLAECYYKGEGIKRDYKKAFELCQKVMECEHVYGAPYMIAECYFYGRGVKQDYKEAVKWYEKTLDVHEEFSYYDSRACYKLGLCYENGYGVTKSKEIALNYYEGALDGDIETEEEWHECEAAYKRLAGKEYVGHSAPCVGSN